MDLSIGSIKSVTEKSDESLVQSSNKSSHYKLVHSERSVMNIPDK